MLGMYILSSVCLILSKFSQPSFVRLCVLSLPISLVMIGRMVILNLIIIIKSKVWTTYDVILVDYKTCIHSNFDNCIHVCFIICLLIFLMIRVNRKKFYSTGVHTLLRDEIFSALLAICVVTGEFPSQRPVTRSFDVFFDLRLNKRLSKQSWGWWSETPSCSLWRHCNNTFY